MKKLLVALTLTLSMFTFAQTNFTTGTKMIEVGYNTLNGVVSPTGFGYYSQKGGNKNITVGISGGYFIADNLAVKGTLGFSNTHKDGNTIYQSFGYGAGLQYFAFDRVSIQAMWKGSQIKGYDNASFLSAQLGYAFILNNKFVITPNVLYDWTLNKRYNQGFGVGLNFAYLLK